MESTSFQKFRARLQFLRQHLQASDAGLSLLSETAELAPDQSILISSFVKPGKYSELNHPASEADRIINHSRSLNAEFALIALYRYFTEYLRNLLGELYATRPLEVVNKAGQNLTLSYTEIVKLGDFKKITDEMVDTVFRKLEDMRSTQKLLEKILSGAGVTVDQTRIDDALCYLEMRHLLIHNNGEVDGDYEKRFGKKVGASSGQKLPRRFDTVKDAIEAVNKLTGLIDHELLAKKLIASRIKHSHSIPQKITASN
jgi:hypothetical protein